MKNLEKMINVRRNFRIDNLCLLNYIVEFVVAFSQKSYDYIQNHDVEVQIQSKLLQLIMFAAFCGFRSRAFETIWQKSFH